MQNCTRIDVCLFGDDIYDFKETTKEFTHMLARLDLDLDETITTFHSLQVYLVVYLVSFIVTLQVGDRSVRL